LFSQTKTTLEQFDDQHNFERMCADVLNGLGYNEIVFTSPRDAGGRDITFISESGEKGLAFVTLHKDIRAKFNEAFSKRQAGEYSRYILFCTTYLTASQKQMFVHYCSDILKAEFVTYDLEALRVLLDNTLPSLRES